jgi:hypothetical protein
MKGNQMLNSYTPGPWVTTAHVEVGDLVYVGDAIHEVAFVGSEVWFDASGYTFCLGRLAVEDDWTNPFVRRTFANLLAERGLDTVGMA